MGLRDLADNEILLGIAIGPLVPAQGERGGDGDGSDASDEHQRHDDQQPTPAAGPAVIPVDIPTVEKAEIHSNRISSSGSGLIAAIHVVATKISDAPQHGDRQGLALDLRFEPPVEHGCVAPPPVSRTGRWANSTKNVVTLMPPAVPALPLRR